MLIPLTKGKFAIVDEIDEDLAQFKWYTLDKGWGAYAQRSVSLKVARPRKHVLMSREIGERIEGRQLVFEDKVDHKNGDTLDNRRTNLRVVTNAINGQNRTGMDARNKSGHRGVFWRERDQRWVAQARQGLKNFHLGYFLTIEEAIVVAQSWRKENMPGYVDREMDIREIAQ